MCGKFEGCWVSIYSGHRLLWYYFNFGGNVDNATQQPIVTLLNKVSGKGFFTFVTDKSNNYIYAMDTKIRQLSNITDVQVLEPKSRTWKRLSPLVKVRKAPKIVTLGSKIYAVSAELKEDLDEPFEKMKDIEVLTHSRNWKLLPLNIPDITNWYHYFVAAFDYHNKLVIGSRVENRLYLFDVSTHELENLNVDWKHIPLDENLPPLVVGINLFWFQNDNFFAYDLVKRKFWEGKIDGMDETTHHFPLPKLIHLGGSELCLIWLEPEPEIPYFSKSIVRFYVFSVPEFIEKNGRRSLRGHVHSSYMWVTEFAEQIINVVPHFTDVH